MKHIAFAAVFVALLSAPAASQEEDEGFSLMEQGAKLFFKGIMQEMEPALDDMKGLAQEMEPALRDFAQHMGPALRDLMDDIDDWAAYNAPEILPNGDIIMRRKIPLVPDDEENLPQADIEL